MDTIAKFKLSVCGIEELHGHCETGVTHVLSILDPDRAVPSAFGAFGEHAKLEFRFHDVIEEQGSDIIPPGPQHVADILAFGRDLEAEPDPARHLLVHCHAGVSRSTASMALILAQARPDVPASLILAEIVRIRPQAWPNLRIIEMGDEQLGRGGDLIAAAAGVYRDQLARQPHLAEQFTRNGRGREVAAGQA